MKAFSTKKEAENYLESLGMRQSNDGNYWYIPGTYRLNHGECERPEYKPRRYGNGWGIRVDYYYYQGTLNAPESGRLDSYKAEYLEYRAA